MYTGYQIRQNQILKKTVKTQFGINDTHIQCPLGRPTGCYLVDSHLPDVKHIYGPDGYTKFYVQDEHIYGPNEHLPWFESHESDR